MNRFKELRVAKGFKTQKELADHVFVNQTAVSQWERGVTTPCNQMLQKLSEVYDVSVDYLLGLTDDPEKKPALTDEDGLDEKQRMVYNRLLKLTPENLEIAIGQLDVLLTLQEKRDKNETFQAQA